MASFGNQYGLISASIADRCSVHEQIHQHHTGLRLSTSGKLVFIAILIPKRIYNKVGPLDESFTKYGYEDDDYCLRVPRACNDRDGWLAICDDCVVRHYHPLNSTYHGPTGQYDGDNQEVFRSKWKVSDVPFWKHQ